MDSAILRAARVKGKDTAINVDAGAAAFLRWYYPRQIRFTKLRRDIVEETQIG